MDDVPYLQPLPGPEPQYVLWGVLLVRPIGQPPRPAPPRAADQRSRAYPTLLCVLRWGRYGHRGGGGKSLRLGPSLASSVGPFRPAPHFAVWFAVVGFPSLPGGVVVVGRFFPFSWPCCLCPCPPLPWLWFAVGVCVRGAVRARVVSVLVCVSCVRGVVGVGVPSLRVGVCVCVCGCVVGAGWGLLLVWVWVWSVCAVAGPSLAGVRWRQWCVVCGVWFVVCGVQRWCVGGVVAGVWCGWSLATPGGGSCVLFPATPGWVSLPVVVGVPLHSWPRVPGAVSRHSWLDFAVGGGGRSSPLLAEGPGCGSPPLLAGVRWRRWCEVCGVWCVVCGVRRWSVGGVVAGVWCGWSLATPGGGSCVLLPATPGWVSLPVVVGGPGHSWRRVPGAVPRPSWLGFAVDGGVWCVVCGVWCVVWLVPHNSWRRFLCATPRHSWLCFAAGGGGRTSPLLAEGPGRGSPPLLAGVRWRRWCVVGLWLVCGVVGPSPLLAEVPVCYSPPLLAGFRCRWWCAAPHHSWLGSAGGGGAWCVVCGVWCVVSGGGVLVGLWLVCGVVGPSPLLAEVPVCYSPPLLAGFRCRWWWAVLATPG